MAVWSPGEHFAKAILRKRSIDCGSRISRRTEIDNPDLSNFLTTAIIIVEATQDLGVRCLCC
jgi:hypothetical protein